MCNIGYCRFCQFADSVSKPLEQTCLKKQQTCSFTCMLFTWLFKMIFNEIIVTQLWGLGGRADFVGSASAAHHHHDPPQPARLWSQHQRGLQPPWQTQKWGYQYHFTSWFYTVLHSLVLLITSCIMHKCQSESSSLLSTMCCILLFCSWQISNTKWV